MSAQVALTASYNSGASGPGLDLASRLVGAAAGAGVRSALTGTDFATNLRSGLSDVVGQTLGGLVASQLEVSAAAGGGGAGPNPDASPSGPQPGAALPPKISDPGYLAYSLGRDLARLSPVDPTLSATALSLDAQGLNLTAPPAAALAPIAAADLGGAPLAPTPAQAQLAAPDVAAPVATAPTPAYSFADSVNGTVVPLSGPAFADGAQGRITVVPGNTEPDSNLVQTLVVTAPRRSGASLNTRSAPLPVTLKPWGVGSAMRTNTRSPRPSSWSPPQPNSLTTPCRSA